MFVGMAVRPDASSLTGNSPPDPRTRGYRPIRGSTHEARGNSFGDPCETSAALGTRDGGLRTGDVAPAGLGDDGGGGRPERPGLDDGAPLGRPEGLGSDSIRRFVHGLPDTMASMPVKSLQSL